MNQKPLPLRGHLYALFSMILWSSSFIFSRQILAWLDPKATMALRFTTVVITAALFCVILRIKPPKARDLPLFLVAGLTGFTIYMILFHEGMATVDSATGSLLLAIVPLFTALLAHPLYGEKLSPLSWGGVLLSLSGIVLLIAMEGGVSADPGIFMLVGSSLSAAAYSLIQRQLLKTYEPLAVSLYSMIIGGLLLQVFLPPAIPQILASPPQAWAIVLYMGVFPGVVGYAVWCKALSMAHHTNDVTNYLFTGPMIATVMAYLIGGEVPTLPTVLGGVITVAGLLLFCFAKSREAKRNKQEAAA